MVTLDTLHPAKRRKFAARAAAPADHDVLLRPLGSASLASAFEAPEHPILTSDEANVIEALVADLQRDDWRTRLRAMQRRRVGADDIVELNQPIHRKTQVVLYEAVCKRPGAPRLDATQITSAGLVVRKLGAAGREAWTAIDGRIVGWRRADETAGYDPDPDQRRSSHKANAAIRAAIAQRKGIRDAAREAIVNLFVMPPAVCEARGKTILFGIIPVTSTEVPEGPGPSIDFTALDSEDRADIVGHFSSYLGERAATAMPRAGEVLDPRWNVLSDPRKDDAAQTPDAQMKAFGLFLHQAMSELDLFGPSAASQRLRTLFAQIRLPLARDSLGRVVAEVDAAGFLRDAMRVLVDASPQSLGLPADAPMPAPVMPLEWPRIDAAMGAALTEAALECLSALHARHAPQEPRFHGDANQYQVRGFIRLKGHGDCPEKLVWSGYSEPYRIVPWWDGDGPGVRISLPAMDKLRKINPNVTFDIPASIGKILSSDLKKLGDGEDPGAGVELGWLCSFSIPIITLCAFIVLHIFLSLLNIVFQWMMWIKVCIPIPRKKAA